MEASFEERVYNRKGWSILRGPYFKYTHLRQGRTEKIGEGKFCVYAFG
jgi:hypothetical protein